MIRALPTLLVATLILGLAACGGAAPEAPEAGQKATSPVAERVEVSDLRVRATPPGAPNSAAFMTLTVEGASAAVVSAASPAAKKVELHTHTEVDGMMQMRPIERIELPAGEAVVLKPGGLHVMLLGLTDALVEGGQTEITLTFDDGSTKALSAPVQAIQPVHAGMHHEAGTEADEGGTCACGKAEGECGHHAKAGHHQGQDAEATCACGKAEGECGHDAKAGHHQGQDAEATCACGKAAGECTCGGHEGKGHGAHGRD